MVTHAPITGAPTRASSNIIPFPDERIVRSMEVKSALEIIERCEKYAVSDDTETRTIVSRLTVQLERQLQRRGIRGAFLKRDGVDQ